MDREHGPTTSERALWWFLVGLTIAPLWLATHPPMVDLPQHAAQIVDLERWLREDPAVTELYALNWFTPYLLGYALTLALSPAFGVVVALKLVLSAAFVGYAAVSRAIVVWLGGRRAWAYVVLPGAYGFAAHWGFLNFVVAVPVALAAVGVSLRWLSATRPSRRGLWIIVGAMHATFVCHALLGVMVGSIGASMALVGQSTWRARILRAIPFASAAPLAIVWAIASRRPESDVAGDVWALSWSRFPAVFSLIFGQPPETKWVLGALVLLALPFLVGARFTRTPARWVPLVVAVSALLVFPFQVFQTAWLFPRFAVFVLPFWLLVLDPHPLGALRPIIGKVAVPLVVAVLLVLPIMNAHAFERDTAGFRRIVARMEPGKRVLSLVFERESSRAPAPVYLHYPVWYVAERGGRVDYSFAMFLPQVMRFRPDRRPAIPNQFEWNPGSFDWVEHRGADYDYFLVRADHDLRARLFSAAEVPIRLVAHDGQWWLYAAGSTASASPPSDTAASP